MEDSHEVQVLTLRDCPAMVQVMAHTEPKNRRFPVIRKPRIREGVVAAGIAGLLSLGMAGGVAGAATTVPWHGPSPGVTATAPGDGPPILTIDHSNGAVTELHLNAPIVGHASTPNRNGEWLVAADGGVFAFGDAGFYGSVPGSPSSEWIGQPITGITVTVGGTGYDLATASGTIYAFGSQFPEGNGGVAPATT